MRNKIPSAVLLDECRYWRLFPHLVLGIWRSSILTFVHYITNLANSSRPPKPSQYFGIWSRMWCVHVYFCCSCPQIRWSYFCRSFRDGAQLKQQISPPKAFFDPDPWQLFAFARWQLICALFRSRLSFCYSQLRSIASLTFSKNASPPVIRVAKIRKTNGVDRMNMYIMVETLPFGDGIRIHYGWSRTFRDESSIGVGIFAFSNGPQTRMLILVARSPLYHS
jgi:hypothetical protein